MIQAHFYCCLTVGMWANPDVMCVVDDGGVHPCYHGYHGRTATAEQSYEACIPVGR